MVQKDQLLSEAKKHVDSSIEAIGQEIPKTEELLAFQREMVKQDPDLWLTQVEINEMILEKLQILQASPYFVRCDVRLDGLSLPQTYYFAKASFMQRNIFSWIVPAAQIRFSDPGKFSYKLPDGRVQNGELLRKDQYVIVNGKITFMSTESRDTARQLIYQEYLSNKKSGFVLQEIVELMEKAQDAVIRASHRGSFLISGPAGSGKTTLALHRVAYLTQSPEIAQYYPGESIIVFVQDDSTKAYFTSLLPQLGINNVTITTFPEWAFKILNLHDFTFTVRFGDDEETKDVIEYHKGVALSEIEAITKKNNVLDSLKQFYDRFLPSNLRETVEKQLEEKILDRFDMTIMLYAHILQHGSLSKDVKDFRKTKNKRKFLEVILKESLKYSLIIVDEVQNYLPEQISLIRTCIDPLTQAMLYVGDLAQQTHLKTVRSWESIGEEFALERSVVLQKVYRNTKQIISYIQSLGYEVRVPEGLKEGPEVQVLKTNTIEDDIRIIAKIAAENKDSHVGVMVKTQRQKANLMKLLPDLHNTHVLTINEAQGVEFEIAILANVHTNDFIPPTPNEKYPEDLAAEKTKVNYDLIYVALTRAIHELIVTGPDNLEVIAGTLKEGL